MKKKLFLAVWITLFTLGFVACSDSYELDEPIAIPFSDFELDEHMTWNLPQEGSGVIVIDSRSKLNHYLILEDDPESRLPEFNFDRECILLAYGELSISRYRMEKQLLSEPDNRYTMIVDIYTSPTVNNATIEWHTAIRTQNLHPYYANVDLTVNEIRSIERATAE